MHNEIPEVILVIKRSKKAEKSIPAVYKVIDNDLARDNVENDLPLADQEDI